MAGLGIQYTYKRQAVMHSEAAYEYSTEVNDICSRESKQVPMETGFHSM